MSTSKFQRSVLITGCSSGIGHALALEFHAQGLKVIATARSVSSIKDLADLGIATLELDVTKDEVVLQVRDQVSEITGGKLDILVNNAGQSYVFAGSDIDMDKVQEMYNANVFGPMRMVKACVPLLIASGDARIVQIGSIVGIAPLPYGSAYNGSKAALHAYGDTIRIELAPFGIKVINVYTGGVQSTISYRQKITGLPDGSIYKPIEDIFRTRRVNMSQRGAMPTEDYAKRVVSVALKKSPPPRMWAGSSTWSVWFVSTFLWWTVFDKYFSITLGFNKLAGLLKSGKIKMV